MDRRWSCDRAWSRRPASSRSRRLPCIMPKFEKSSPELVARFAVAMERNAAPDVTQRQMFGYPCAWIGGNMLTGLFAEEWWVRGSELDRDGLMALPRAPPLP